MKGKIRVYCRVRPMNQQEAELGSIDAIQQIDPFTLRIRTKKDAGVKGQAAYSVKEFVYDSVFGPESSQDKIFEDTRMLIQSAVDGYNVCIFAYGQTGSGKTYTVSGGEGTESRGIVPRGFQEMFAIKQRLEKDRHFTVTFQCMMMELYLDKLHDLLGDGSGAKLDIREDPYTGEVVVQNAKTKALKTVTEALDTFNEGMRSRRVAGTDMNDQSSRSHLVFTVMVTARNNQSGEMVKGKVSFVDLAGSERSAKANGNVERQNEANHINVSLSALGKVIQVLAKDGEKAP